MSRDLYPYYERELLAIRQLAGEFARQYPAAAGRLLLEPTGSTDPHVERMIQAFALLAGRVHHKLDDEFPELTDALLNVLYPHYLAPVPSAAVVQFDAAAARTPLNDGFLVPRGSRLFTPETDQLPGCKYRTAYPVTLWPVALTEARWFAPPFPPGPPPPSGTAAVLRIRLTGEAGARFDKLSLDTLRVHLVGEGHTVGELYEALLAQATRVALVDPDRPTAPPVLLPPAAIAPVGFADDEGLLPYPPQSFPGYRLLTEFFAYPAKFWFLDVTGFGQARAAGFGGRCDLHVYLKRASPNLEAAVEAGTFRLGCTPAVNLFSDLTTTATIDLTQTRHEYRVSPDGPVAATEVYSVDEVVGLDAGAGADVAYRPFYSVDHATGRGAGAFWHPTRRSAAAGDRSTDVYLSLVEADWTPHQPASRTLIVRTTCTNRNLPAILQRAGERLAVGLEMAAPVQAVRVVRSPTQPLRPPRRRGGYWRLLSHLSLNHLSLADGTDGVNALREVLRLYDFSDPDAGQQQAEVNRNLIDGLVGVTSRRAVGRIDDGAASGFCRGVEVTVELDEEKYVGTGAYLFAAVLERFVGAYATINSFTQLVARGRVGNGVIARWPPRAGDRVLV